MPRTTLPRVDSLGYHTARNAQRADFVELLALGAHRLRVHVSSDSYRDQCYARIDRWSGGRWEELWSILPGAMATADKLAYTKTFGRVDIEADRDTLISFAIKVLA